MSPEPITATQAAAAATTSAVAGWVLPFDFIGIPAAVVFLALAGAAAGLIVQPPKVSRLRMYLLAMAFTGFGAALAVLVIRFVPAVKDAAPAVAFLIAFFAQVIEPAARERLRREVRERGAPADSGGSPS